MKKFCVCSRLYRFEASHFERMRDRKDAVNNTKIFGRAIMPHGHNYELKLNLAGPINPETGMVIELGEIDDLVSEYLDILDHRNLSADPIFHCFDHPTTHEAIALEIFNKLYYKICVPYLQGICLSEQNGESQIYIHKGDYVMNVYYTKNFTFNAQHSLKNVELTAEENAEIFGKCVRPHGHDYTLKITINGVPNKKTNKLLIESSFEEEINNFLERFHYSDLNALPEFLHQTPTTENIIQVFYSAVKQVVESLAKNEYCGDVKLAFIELQETNRNRFVYFGDEKSKSAMFAASIT